MFRQPAVKKSKGDPLFAELFPDEFVAAFSNRACGNMSLNPSAKSPDFSPGMEFAKSILLREGALDFSPRGSTYADTKDSLVNRRSFLEGLGIDPESLVCAKQIHGVQVKRVDSFQKGRGALAYETAIPDIDALITSEKNLPVAIFTADCLSIFLFDPQTESIGLVHAGWRGTYGRIVQKTIEAMKREFHTCPENICVQFGPSIRSCCYQVSGDFREKFPGNIEERGKCFFLDLAGANRQQLSLCGVKFGNIRDCAICTSCRNGEYFSYRSENDSSGRMMSVMMLS